MIKHITIATIFIASAIGGFAWLSLHESVPLPHLDHISTISDADYANGRKRQADVINRMTPRLTRELESKGLKLGAPVFLRVHKESRELEVWVKKTNAPEFVHFRTWKIAAMSGNLGPKLAEGDFQAPEGFYYVTPQQMKPDSRFHLAFNIGFPNNYDRSQRRTGSFIMVHGNEVSAGCLAMTDNGIEEIYTLCHSALENGQPYFRVHIFPFKMTRERLYGEENNQWYSFWMNLKEGYEWFEKKKSPPNVTVGNGRYLFD